jgi:S1-C subfamily serine protease
LSKAGTAVIKTGDGTGSGFVVAHQNGKPLIITNSHVVDGQDTVEVQWFDGSSDSATVASTADGESLQTDLALISIDALRGTPLTLTTQDQEVGQEVYVIGAPKGLEFSLSKGVISSLRDNGQILQTSAAINPGNSGGPVLDGSSCVVGMATFKLRDAESLNFAVATSVIRSFLENPPAGESQQVYVPPTLPSRQPTSECAFKSYKDPEPKAIGCSVSSSQNTNGHWTYNVKWLDGYESTYVLWSNGGAEIISKNGQGVVEVDKGSYESVSSGMMIKSSEDSLAYLPISTPKLN